MCVHIFILLRITAQPGVVHALCVCVCVCVCVFVCVFVAGAAGWSKICSEGRIRPYRGRAKGPMSARVELYKGSVQSIVGGKEGTP